MFRRAVEGSKSTDSVCYTSRFQRHLHVKNVCLRTGEIRYWGSNFLVHESSIASLKIELKMKCLNRWKQNGLSEKLFNWIKITLKALPKNPNRKYLEEIEWFVPPHSGTWMSKLCKTDNSVLLTLWSESLKKLWTIQTHSIICLFQCFVPCQFQRNWKQTFPPVIWAFLRTID